LYTGQNHVVLGSVFSQGVLYAQSPNPDSWESPTRTP